MRLIRQPDRQRAVPQNVGGGRLQDAGTLVERKSLLRKSWRGVSEMADNFVDCDNV